MSEHCKQLLVDKYLPSISKKFPEYRDNIDISLLALCIVGVGSAVCIIK